MIKRGVDPSPWWNERVAAIQPLWPNSSQFLTGGAARVRVRATPGSQLRSRNAATGQVQVGGPATVHQLYLGQRQRVPAALLCGGDGETSCYYRIAVRDAQGATEPCTRRLAESSHTSHRRTHGESLQTGRAPRALHFGRPRAYSACHQMDALAPAPSGFDCSKWQELAGAFLERAHASRGCSQVSSPTDADAHDHHGEKTDARRQPMQKVQRDPGAT